MTLEPGDVLLYRPRGVFGWIIRVKTWHPIAHVETYVGRGASVASRDGLGVGRYPLRLSELAMICRPTFAPLNWARADVWFAAQKGTPYGWADLLQFAGLNVDARGIVCSPFIARHCRMLGYDPFNGEDPQKIAPFQFSVSPVFDIYEVNSNGEVRRRDRELVSQAS